MRSRPRARCVACAAAGGVQRRESRSSRPATSRPPPRDDDGRATAEHDPRPDPAVDRAADDRDDDHDAAGRRCRRARSTPSTASRRRWRSRSGTASARSSRPRSTDLTEEYNASQDKVRVNLENQGGYNQTIDKYVQSRQRSRPELVMFPEYMVQQIADSDSVIPIGACIEASGFDTTPFLPRTLLAYETEGVQWSMPFNVSDPVLYYNRKVFEEAGLDPDGLARCRSRSCGRPRRRSSTRARRRRGSPSTRASTPAAAGSSSSGSPGPASCTPTTATAGWRRRPGCCTTARSASR